jgi:hypothetical protein
MRFLVSGTPFLAGNYQAAAVIFHSFLTSSSIFLWSCSSQSNLISKPCDSFPSPRSDFGYWPIAVHLMSLSCLFPFRIISI